ncbi:hypothetical protein KJ628_01605 [Patescibacteria group bacterium]|nr:hypothetical protein [Patescibacteria group bacterium]
MSFSPSSGQAKGGQKDVKRWSKGGQNDYRGLEKIIKLLVRPLSERQTTGMKLQIKLKIVSSRGGEGAN